MERTELERKTPMKRGTSRLNAVSARRRPAFRRATKWRQQYLAEHPNCEIDLSWGSSLLGLTLDECSVVFHWIGFRPCTWQSVDVHEVIKRGRGGSTTDEGNVLACCRNCHDFTEAHPRVATALGLLASNPKWRDG
jgi:hypothetical protein